MIPSKSGLSDVGLRIEQMELTDVQNESAGYRFALLKMNKSSVGNRPANLFYSFERRKSKISVFCFERKT